MKFLCDRCKTKYSIADEKVRRKILKIRCKNCSNIITVRDPDARGPEPAPAREARGGGAAALPLESALQNAFSAAMSEPAAARMPEFRPEVLADDEWYVALGGQQQGPMPFARVKELLERGEIGDETFVWREGLDDWSRADAVPELRSHLRRKKLSAPPSSTRAGAKREVPRPSAGKLAPGHPGAAAAAGPPHEEHAAPGGLGARRPRFDHEGGADLEDLTDALEDDESGVRGAARAKPGVPAIGHGGLFSAADQGKLPDHRDKLDSSSSASSRSSSGKLDLQITEPSRIVKLDAIIAAGRATTAKVGTSTGQVFQLPGLGGRTPSQDMLEGLVRSTPSTGAPLSDAYPPAMVPQPSSRDQGLYKVLAMAGGMCTLLLAVVVIFLVSRNTTPKTIVIEKEKSPEDLGAEIAEQIVREEATKRVGFVPHVQQDAVPPARSGPPPRRSTMPPPPHKLAEARGGIASRGDGDRLSKLYGDGRSGPDVRMPERPPEDALGQFKRGAKLCYERAAKRNPALSNIKVEVAIHISGSGQVSSVDIPYPYRTDVFGGCLSGLIKKLPWPSKGDPYTLEAPLVFTGS